MIKFNQEITLLDVSTDGTMSPLEVVTLASDAIGLGGIGELVCVGEAGFL